MRARILVPADTRLSVIEATRRPGPPSVVLRGVDPGRGRTTADRVRAAVQNAGFTIPAGAITVEVAGPNGRARRDPGLGTDLPLALAILLADRAHRHLRRPNLVAWGRLGLDGALHPAGEPGVYGLPDGSWIGRFWSPTDHVPEPHEDGVLMLRDVDSLAGGWDALVDSIRMEAEPAREGSHG